jgi:tetratricopeptide (TPR) repeat protein
MTADRASELRERRAFLLASLDDLDRERAAGDLSDADYELLQNDYSRRAAEVLREIETGTSRSSAHVTSGPGTPPPNRGRVVAMLGAFLVFAVGAGILVARLAGERTGNDGLTGTVRSATANMADAKVEALLQKGRDSLAIDPLTAITTFDEASALDPTRAEAFAYAGWVLRIVAQSVEDPAQKQELLDGAFDRIEKAISIAPRYPDARAFRGVMLLRDRDDPKAALADFVALEQLNPPAQIEQLVASARREAEDAVAELG